MLNILTAVPGTVQFDERMEAEDRIFRKGWRLYDRQFAVFRLSQMTPARLQPEVLRDHRRSFASRRWLRHAVRGSVDRLALDSWLWWYARSWHTDKSASAAVP